MKSKRASKQRRPGQFAEVPSSAKYRCNLCFCVVTRKSNKRWMPSCCTKHDVMARLYRISPNAEVSDQRGAGSLH